MKNNSSNQIKIGMILSYINIAIGNLIPLFYTPIMLDLLGQSEYGLYKIASSTSSYLSLLTFGIGSAVSRYLIKAKVEGGKSLEEKTFGLFNLIFQIISILTLLVGGIIVLCLDLLYGKSMTGEELTRMRILVALMVINTAISFSASAYNAVVSTHERFTFIQTINILSTVGAPVLNLVFLYLGYKSVGMAIVSLGINVLTRVIYLVYVNKALNIKPKYKEMPFSILREVLMFSFWLFVSTIVSRINTSTDLIVIGSVPSLATTGAAVYSIGYTFSSIMFSLAQVVPSLFMPKVNKMVFSNCTNEDLSDLLIKVGRIQCFIVALVCSGFIAFGRPFIFFYAGIGYEESYWVAIIIMIPDSIPLVQSIASSIIQAKNKHKFRSIVYIFIAILNIIGTIILVNYYGIIGAAIPTAFSYILGQGLIMNWYYWKKIHLDIPRFWKELLPIFLLAAIMTFIALFVSNWIDFYNISLLLIGIIVYTVIYFIFLWLFIMKPDEKALITHMFKKK